MLKRNFVLGLVFLAVFLLAGISTEMFAAHTGVKMGFLCAVLATIVFYKRLRPVK